jgi:hypothetical protein
MVDDDPDTMGAEIRALGTAIQRLFEGKEAGICIAAMSELISMETVKLSESHVEALEKLAAVHQIMNEALKAHAQKKWGKRH